MIVGMEGAEDAGVYKLSSELAIVQTVDFFTPIVDDPYDFGRIAVANSLSDVYAKGGRPLTALNVVCFPLKTLDISVLREILRGGLDKMKEAGVTLLGGHTVEDPELKYGLSVTGVIHPSNVIFNNRPKAGDLLILTKPLGTGIVSTAIKGGLAREESVLRITRCMCALNRKASELMLSENPSACTDVTGFGLLGHASEMIQGAGVCMEIDSSAIPFFPDAVELSEMGMVPGGLHRNRNYLKNVVEISKDVPRYLEDILYDPQTSGGLLISLPEKNARTLLNLMHDHGIEAAAIIGSVVSGPSCRITVR